MLCPVFRGLTHQKVDTFIAAHNVNRNHRRFGFQYLAQFRYRLGRLAVDANDDVIFMQTYLSGRAAFLYA